MRNILAKLPHLMQGQMKRLIQQAFLASSHAQALKRERALIAQFRDRYPGHASVWTGTWSNAFPICASPFKRRIGWSGY